MVELKTFIWFARVADLNGFRRAAASLPVSQSALTRRIQALEDTLGVSLFERGPGGTRLTNAGTTLLSIVRPLLQSLDGALEQARAAGRAEAGALSVGSCLSLSKGEFRSLIIEAAAWSPRVALRLVEGDRESLLAGIGARAVDVAILIRGGDAAGWDIAPLWRELLSVAMSAGHPLAAREAIGWAELSGETFLLGQRGSGSDIRALLDTRFDAMGGVRIAMHDVGREGLVNLVGAGLGVTLVAQSSTGVPYRGVAFRPIVADGGAASLPLAAYWDPTNDNPALRRFLALMRARYGGSGSVDRGG